MLAAILLCSLIVTSFAGILLRLRVAWVLGALLVAAMLALMVALGLFLQEGCASPPAICRCRG